MLSVFFLEREEKLAKEKEEGKPEKKRKKYSTKKTKNAPAANSAGEAFEKMLQEKKMSTKINYEVLKNLSLPKSDKEAEESLYSRLHPPTLPQKDNPTVDKSSKETSKEVEAAIASESEIDQSACKYKHFMLYSKDIFPKRKKTNFTRNFLNVFPFPGNINFKFISCILVADDGDGDEDMEDVETDAVPNEISLSQLLNRHDNDESEVFGDDYDEDDY